MPLFYCGGNILTDNKDALDIVGDVINDRNIVVNAKSPKSLGSENTSNKTSKSMWHSRISWQIVFTVFITMLVVQICILIVTTPEFENEKLQELQEVARVAISSAIDPNMNASSLSSPISAKTAKHIIIYTNILGISVYSLDNRLLASYGDPPIMKPSPKLKNTYSWKLSNNKEHFEVMYTPMQIGHPFMVVVHIDSSKIITMIKERLKRNILIFLLLSGFVTSVLMLALGQWLLEPIIMISNNLFAAMKNPENPKIEHSSKKQRNEVYKALMITNNLIRQNAENIKKLRSQAADRIHQLAYFDRLTKLPNRTMFLEKLDELIKNHVLKGGKRLVVMTIDLDRFKDVNDTLGHEIGDKVLEAVAHRFVHSLDDNAIISRASADEFNVAVPIDKKHQHIDFANKIFRSLEEPISIYQESFQINTSIGMAYCPDDGVDGTKLLKNADIALNRAKEDGRNTARYYSEEFDQIIQKRFQVLRDLRIAIEKEQFKVFYQPQFNLHTGELIGAEALIRWFQPDNSKEGGTFVSPAEFIPIAEQSGLIVPIGEWVLKKACMTNQYWREQGVEPGRIAVNISGVQFHRSSLVDIVQDTLEETGLLPEHLELEVTESIFMDDVENTIVILKHLHQLGIELAIDDFGTGYSSLSYLRQFPIDRLKIDQSFIRNALSNADDIAITKTIISLGHSMGLKVIAEGVETIEHENFLKQEGCDEVQGFKYSKPIPENEFLQFIRTYAGDLSPPKKLTQVK